MRLQLIFGHFYQFWLDLEGNHCTSIHRVARQNRTCGCLWTSTGSSMADPGFPAGGALTRCGGAPTSDAYTFWWKRMRKWKKWILLGGALFGENVCENKRNGSCWGGTCRQRPHGSANGVHMCLIFMKWPRYRLKVHEFADFWLYDNKEPIKNNQNHGHGSHVWNRVISSC